MVLRLCIVALLAVASSVCFAQTNASDYPNKFVRFIVPYAPGGSSDVLARTLGQKLGDALNIKTVARATAIQLNTYAPMMANSDHYNFARHGIPAMRLVAGFDRPETNIRYILTKQDTREKVKPFELRGGARVAAMIVWRALTMSDSEIRELRKS